MSTSPENQSPLSPFSRQPGIGTGLWERDPLLPDVHLPMIQEAGFKALELNFYFGKSHFDWNDAGAVRALRRAADDLGLLVWSIHSPDLKPLTSDRASERQEQVDILKHCLDVGAELGAKVVVSHALLIGSYDEDPRAAVERVRGALDAVHDHAEGGPVAIGYENTPFVSAPEPVRTTNVLKRLEDFPRSTTGFVWDTGHANMYGDQEEIAEKVGDRLLSWHLNDNPGDQDIHLVPGEGTVDWAVVGRVMDAFRGPFIYEIMSNGHAPRERMETTMAWHRCFVGPENRREES